MGERGGERKWVRGEGRGRGCEGNCQGEERGSEVKEEEGKKVERGGGKLGGVGEYGREEWMRKGREEGEGIGRCQWLCKKTFTCVSTSAV